MAGLKTKRGEPPKLSLPTERQVPSAVLADYSLLIYGRKKIGKTTLAAEFPDAVFLEFDPNRALRIFKTAPRNWDECKGYVKLLRGSKFKNVVVDTVDVAYKFCERWCCSQMGIEHPSDEGYGKGWGRVRDEFTLWIQSILSSGLGTVFISHEKEREIKRRSGETTTRIGPSMPGGAMDVLVGIVDLIGYYCYDQHQKRVLQIAGDDVVEAGHRIKGHFLGQREIPMGTSAEEAYGNLVKAFENRLGRKEDGAGGVKRKIVVRK